MSEIITPKCPQCGSEMPPSATGRVCPRCAAAFLKADPTEVPGVPGGSSRPFTPPSVTELAPLFPQLEILQLIGQGGMGAVYKARQKELDRIVALKILPPGFGDAAFADRFAREAKALARLNHPGIVTIYEFGRCNGLFFFLMEFVDGATLRQVLHGGRISPREALAIVPAICDALQYAHDQGIVHRDIKPENILLDRRGRTKVADFGLAKLMESGSASSEAFTPAASSTETHSGKVLGTPQYMAPEQAEHPAAVDHRADIYALGVVFYQMLTGELPGKPIQPPSKKVSIDVRLDEVVLHALEKEPERRYQTAAEFKTVVETISSPSSAGTATVPSPARPAATSGRLRAALIVGVLVWLVAGILTLIMWPSWKVVAVISCPEKSQPGRLVDEHFKFIATMMDLIRSDVILGRVIDRLELDERSGKLDKRWGKRNLGLKLTKAQAMVLLKRRLDVRSEGGTLIQLGVWGKRPERPEEAVDIADTIAQELRAYRIEQHDPPADMLEMTLRGTLTTLRLADILLGLASGFLPGLLAGGLVLWRGSLRRGPQASQLKMAVETILQTEAPHALQSQAGLASTTTPFGAPSGSHAGPSLKRASLGLAAGAATVLAISMVLAILACFRLFLRSPGPLGGAPEKQVSATTARQGDIGVYLDYIGTVQSSNSVVFNLSEDYCQLVIKKFDAHETLTVEAYNRQGEKFGHGFLSGVDNLIDTSTGTLKCRATLIPDEGNLMVPGLFLNVRLLVEMKHGVTLVPDFAIQRDPQSAFVWVIRPDQTVARRPVRVGTVDGSWAEIQSGLSPGEIVATDQFNHLREGQKVRVNLAPKAEAAQASSQPGEQAASQNAAKDLEWLRIQSLDGWISDLQNPDQKIQQMAERALTDLGTNALPGFLKILSESTNQSSEDEMRRYYTAQALRYIGPGVKSGLPAFEALLKSGQREKAYSGARALAFSVPLVPEAFSILTNGLTDPAAGVRDAASHGVALCLNTESNSFAEPALPLLVRNLHDKVDYVRADTVTALMIYALRQGWGWQSPPRDAKPGLLIPPLIELLHDKYPDARERAARALECFGSGIKPWIPVIQSLLADPDDATRQSVKNLLRVLRELNMLPALIAGPNPGPAPGASVAATGTSPLSYQWAFDGTNNATGATNLSPK